MERKLVIFTSYFYRVRFMDSTLVPLSTAMWDPKWFHDNKSQSYAFKDKNGVYNGLRADPFVPGDTCSSLCRGIDTCNTKDPSKCEFLSEYRRQLDRLDFNSIIEGLSNLANTIKEQEGVSYTPAIVLLFHETPNNKCSERVVVQQWFRDHDYPINEY